MPAALSRPHFIPDCFSLSASFRKIRRTGHSLAAIHRLLTQLHQLPIQDVPVHTTSR